MDLPRGTDLQQNSKSNEERASKFHKDQTGVQYRETGYKRTRSTKAQNGSKEQEVLEKAQKIEDKNQKVMNRPEGETQEQRMSSKNRNIEGGRAKK
eukprot:1359285-Amorphochlora_amoeboformis.AAC.2